MINGIIGRLSSIRPRRRRRSRGRRAARYPRVVIVGAGFGGLECARELARKPVDVTLLDRNNYHLFTPLLYQVASSLLNPSDIAHPVRAIIRGMPNVRFLQATVTGVDFDQRVVHTETNGPIPYDIVVLASGSTTNYFGLRSLESSALGLKDLPEALELRNHVISRLEAAAATTDPAERRELLTFVVVGGGPTGVEYAGALGELLRLVVPREYPELHPGEIRLVLVEALGSLLAAFPSGLGEDAERSLARRGVEVMVDTYVTDAVDSTITLSSGETISAGTVVWAAGVKPGGLAAAIEAPHSRSGRIEVDRYLRIPGRDDAFAIGDVASVQSDGREIPMLSSPAIQEGRCVAANIVRSLRREPLRTFRYRDRGSMATIGRSAAVAAIGPFRLRGLLGWLVWLAVHLYFLIGFRNRLVVLLGWAWNYLRFDRPVRIIARAQSRAGNRSQ